MTSRIAATSKRPAKGRAAFACAYARGGHLLALGLMNEDQMHPGGGSA